MSVRGEQKVINVNGVIYDAVTSRSTMISCAGCEFHVVACHLVGCYPGERADKMWAIWKRRITNTPAEGALP
jgi:hypothetical protein